ncbi:hypothetical protein EI42_06137 [Thermosporothrix hazakensis]|uniref:Uncharacterized protein n=1 Tax=Thermosporothrix hazakensis TaxID=644383 RepID=A0A326TV82_THEHA|nr:hypothetical protein [Thermosporothrix hazakensis]PZW19324.1 hypothetical protein EI42_06137 [Thermosporothrix hazakensis]GCE48237.1 hypothetical protein KTH_31060 [Thermosporothrix hazakensis]
MFLNAIVLSATVQEMSLYDQVTGAKKPSYSVIMNVLDADTDEKYTVQITSGFASLEQLKLLRKHNEPEQVLQQAAQQLQTELPPKMTTMALEVLKVKAKSGFLTLICRLAQSTAMV